MEKNWYESQSCLQNHPLLCARDDFHTLHDAPCLQLVFFCFFFVSSQLAESFYCSASQLIFKSYITLEKSQIERNHHDC